MHAESSPHAETAAAAHPAQHGYNVYFVIWFGLLILTALSVMFARMGLGATGILAVWLITPCKAWLVLSYFMHLRDEKPFLRHFVAAALATLIIFIALTFADVFTR